ncbi:MAG TPA: beta-lactamase family protein [Firmicutes bacterium]|nr:beta-lactamase family protein [Bacillota bacterium]
MCKYTEEIINKARKCGDWLYSIAVAENERLTTAAIRPANRTNDCYSVAKLFTVTALGMLYDERRLDVDERIVDIFSSELPDDIDPGWERVTVDMVMRHRFGIEQGFLDIDVEDLDTYRAVYGTREDFLGIVLSHRLPLEPGTREVYSDAAYYLLSRVVTKKSGEILCDYLRQRLFNLLEFEEAAWSCCPRGYSMGATGLFIRVGDMVKLGQLYLSGGVYRGRRILSEEWCRQVLERGWELRRFGSGYAKGGMYGQFLYISCERRLAVAFMGHDQADASAAMREILYRID